MKFDKMKKILILLPLFIFALSALKAQKQGGEAYFDYGIYDVPGSKAYLESYLLIAGRSLNAKKSHDSLTVNVEVTIALLKDSTVMSYSKEVISKKMADDSLAGSTNITYEKRLQIPARGQYTLELRIDDLNDTLKAFNSGSDISVSLPSDSTAVSSIMAVRSMNKTVTPNAFTKSGYDLVPNVFNFFPTNQNKFSFYCEIYPKGNLKKDEPFLVVYYLRNHESGRVIPKYRSFKRMSARKVNILTGALDISTLASGNFDFIVEVRNKENKLLAQSEYFLQRENLNVKMSLSDISSVNIVKSFVERFKDKDTLTFIMRAMAPISSELEKEFAENLISKGDIYTMQQYVLNFWEQRNAVNPEQPFQNYMNEVTKVEKLYATRIRHGFETDRGRVYLQYGPPNTVVKNYNEPSAYPYEIWHYYNLKNQRNRKFIFYNTDLSTNDFALLHSDAIGEPNDYQWRLHLRGRDSGYKSIDQTGEHETDWGSKYNEWYKEPR